MGRQESAKSSSRLSTEYLSSLKAYWEGRPRTCIERLATTLSLDPDPQEVYRLYRLWIEVLAHQNESQSLRTLLNHFSFFIKIGTDPVTNMALKGLVHFELDEIEGSALMLASVASHKENPYVWELSFQLHRRGRIPRLFDYRPQKANLTDFFHLQSYLQHARGRNLKKEEEFVNTTVKKLYPKAPLEDFVGLHDAMEKKAYSEACHYGETLVAKYPLNPDFSFGYSIALVKMENYEKAITEFERISELHGDSDLDSLNWLGFCQVKLAIQTNNESLAKKSEETLAKAIDMAEDLGIDTDFPIRSLNTVRRSFSGDQDVGKVWLLKVNSSEYGRIRTAPKDKVTHINATISDDAKVGDYCFVFGDDHTPDSGRWRFGALYRVDSTPQWSPYRNAQSQMSLVDRPEHAIPVDIELSTEGSSPRRVFEFDIESGALEPIIDSISDFVGKDSFAYDIFRRAN